MPRYHIVASCSMDAGGGSMGRPATLTGFRGTDRHRKASSMVTTRNPLADMVYPCCDEKYFADDGLNASTIKACVAATNPLAIVCERGRAARRSNETTPAMRLGSATHALALEGERAYKARFAVEPKADRRTKSGKATLAAWLLDHGNAVAITEEQDAAARRMAAAVGNCREASKLLRGGQAETGIFWTDRGTLLPCKAKLDYIAHGDMVVDLKTCADATPAGFRKTIGNFNYHLQAAWYRRAYREAKGELPRFFFVAVEKNPPHSVGVYELNDAWLDAAEETIAVVLRLWQREANGADAVINYGLHTLEPAPWQVASTNAA